MHSKVLFVCHGNIYRSVMAEYMMKKYIKDLGISEMECFSRAVSYEEQGNDIYPAAKACLRKHGIPFERHHAARIDQQDYDNSDVIFIMDASNQYYIRRIVADTEGKIRMLLDRDVADPWYTNDFEKTYADLKEGIENYLREKGYL